MLSTKSKYFSNLFDDIYLLSILVCICFLSRNLWYLFHARNEIFENRSVPSQDCDQLPINDSSGNDVEYFWNENFCTCIYTISPCTSTILVCISRAFHVAFSISSCSFSSKNFSAEARKFVLYNENQKF